MDRIKLRVESDGTSDGTKIFDQDGRTLDNMIDFQFKVGLDGIPEVTMTLVGIPVEINYGAKLTSFEELESEGIGLNIAGIVQG